MGVRGSGAGGDGGGVLFRIIIKSILA